MNKRPVLVIMAAGMGSRYGGLKQVDPVGPCGETLLDYSLYDARLAGFERVIFIITHAIEEEFRKRVGDRIARVMEVQYAFQELNALPGGYHPPQGRVKPWGTGHAVLCCRPLLDGPFAVINADDYYGREGFAQLFRVLQSSDERTFCMVGYRLENTLTENGTVSRGVCRVENGFLKDVHEYTRIEKQKDGPAYTTDDGASWRPLPPDCVVSMNLWGFSTLLMPELESSFCQFLQNEAAANPLKCEFFLPELVNAMIAQNKCRVRVLSSPDRWYGVTYQADRPAVQRAMAKMSQAGLYPTPLWGAGQDAGSDQKKN
ncbi:MAG TPA: nucleotidyltransferase [Candidatus Gallacutalibacter stercoravium]|nr:nucleotidyltransferase [Candidatus Gallacutalibacter stercoravium]